MVGLGLPWPWPLVGWIALALVAVGGSSSGVLAVASGVVLIATVFAAVYHAEVIAYRVGEPFGTLILAMAVR